MNLVKSLKNLFKEKEARYETYISVLITVGLPTIAFLYMGYKAALTTFILTQITLGIFVIRNK